MRTEIKVVVTVALAVLTLEGIIRLWAPVIDWDREHIHAFPEIAARLHAKPSPRVVFFGNSLMLHGLDQDLALEAMSDSSGQGCAAEKIVPVSTAVIDWIYLYDTYFTQSGNHPDILAIGFVPHHLYDVETIKIRRLTRHFCSNQNLWPFLTKELDQLEDRALGLASYHSAIFGDRSTIQHRALMPLVPYYGEGTRSVSRIHKRFSAKKSPPAEKPKTYRNLQRFIEQLKFVGVDAYFVPMPQPKMWDLDPKLVQTIESNSMQIIDARDIAGMTESDFSDGYHLGETGKKKLSRFLGEKIGSKIAN